MDRAAPESIELMGSKTAARAAMRAAGVPIIPGAVDPVRSAEEVVALGEEVRYPLIVKATAGGGGKGMELVREPDEAEHAFAAATRQGEKYFADPTVYVERYLEDPRHVEVQVLADAHGNVIHLGEQDYDPAPPPEARRGDTLARRRRRPSGPHRPDRGGRGPRRRHGSAGTVEGLLTPEGDYFFMEMNTRIQVEHTVTEAVTGLDLVREQVFVAAGEPPRCGRRTSSSAATRSSAASTPRTCPRVPARAGPDHRVSGARRAPASAWTGIEAGDEVTALYDPMIAKLIVHDVDRERAIARMQRAGEFVIEGPPTLLGFHRALLEHPCFVGGGTCEGIVESEELAHARRRSRSRSRI